MPRIDINIPDQRILGGAGIITTSPSSGYYSTTSIVDHIINLDPTILCIPAMDIVRRELSKLEDISLKELTELCKSNDREDFTLALNIMEAKGTKYAHKLLGAIKNSDEIVLMEILRLYNQENRMNLTNDIL